MSALTNKPMPEGNSKGVISPPLRKPAVTPVFKPEFARSLRMHPVVAVVVAGLVFVLLIGFALMQKSMYEAESLVYVEPSALKVLDDGTAAGFDPTRYDSYLQQQVQTAERLDIMEAAVHALPAGVWRGMGESEQSAATRLRNLVKIERVLNSYQLSFTLKGSDAAQTAQTLNAVVAAYLQAGRKDELTTADQRSGILNEEKTRLETELAGARAEQNALSGSLGMANPGLDSNNPYDAQLSGLRTELASAREAHDLASAQLASVSGSGTERTQGLTAAADDLIASDAGLSSMRSTISQRRALLSGQMAGLTPENPLYKQDQVELGNLDRSLDTMTTQMRDRAERRLQDKLRTDLARTGDVEARLNAQLAQETGAATSASPKLQRASELTADIARLMKRFDSVDDSLRSLQLETSGPGTAHLALAATPPLTPLPSRRTLLLLAALPLALFCGAFAAVFMRKRDQRVFLSRDVEDLLGFTPIAVLPLRSEVSDGVMAEYMLRLAGGIEGAYRGNGARTFVLTAVGGEGEASRLVAPLEAQLSQLGLVVSTVTARELMNPNAVPAANSFEDNRREGLVATHLDRLKRLSDLIFIEVPALLMSAESEYLVRCADATILVVESGVTRRGQMLQAALLLERLQVRGIGAVLDGLQLQYADAGFRSAVAELERVGRHSSGVRPVARKQDIVSDVVPLAVFGSSSQESTSNYRPEAWAELHGNEHPVAADEAVEGVSSHRAEGSEQRSAPGEMPSVVPSMPSEDASPLFGSTEEPDVAAMPHTELSRHDQEAPIAASVMAVPAEHSVAQTDRTRSLLDRVLGRDGYSGLSIVPGEEGKDLVSSDRALVTQPQVETAAPSPQQHDLDTLEQKGEPQVLLESQGTGLAGASAASVETPLGEPTEFPVQSRAQEAQGKQVELAEDPLAERSSSLEKAHSPGLVGELDLHAHPLVSVPNMQAEDSVRSIIFPDTKTEANAEPIRAEVQDGSFTDRVRIPAALDGGPGPDIADTVQTLPAKALAEPRLEPQRFRQPLRVARLEAADLPSRADVTPWRDRRISGPSGAYRAAERRFNWSAGAASQGALGEVSSENPKSTATRRGSAPRLVPSEDKATSSGKLTRSWGLLSKFGVPAEAEHGGEAGGDSGTWNSRNRRRG